MRVLLILISLLLVGCAGSPFQTSNLSLYELQSVYPYTLCKAATPRELYSPSQNVLIEVRRRGLDCSGFYTYAPDNGINTSLMIAGLNLAANGTLNPQINSNNNSEGILYSLESNTVSGPNRICIYRQGINRATTTINVAQTCPVIQKFSGINSGVNDTQIPQNNSTSNPQINKNSNAILLYSRIEGILDVDGTTRLCSYGNDKLIALAHVDVPYTCPMTIDLTQTCPMTIDATQTCPIDVFHIFDN